MDLAFQLSMLMPTKDRERIGKMEGRSFSVIRGSHVTILDSFSLIFRHLERCRECTSSRRIGFSAA